ncbi:hypothetical protein JOL79_33010 [Microbispora sp. RL4-1S]|uniref:Lipoprotein n=1 Tax=Microbispora oryzae TaxID=2806554 RepID=A0A940WRH9_9ACTN|nr:hypothetical protein [Microbispora oryzae]MBP2708602.1 hypothetical protein [Microbispora oryzae]
MNRRDATGRAVAIATATLLLAATAGCSSARDAGVAAVVKRFYDAVSEGRGAAACALLAPRTVAELAAAGDDCAESIVKLRRPGAVRAVQIWGSEAQVRLTGDTVFLHSFPQGWRVRAAGCRARGEEPYLCVVGG